VVVHRGGEARAVGVERYLRALGEREVRTAPVGPGGLPWTPVAVAAGVLVALGLIDAATAEGLVSEYKAASALRRRPLPVSPMSVTSMLPEIPPGPATPPRVVPVARRFATGWGHLDVHYVVLGPTTTLVVTLHLPPTRGLTAFGEPNLPGWTDGRLRVTDDRGTVAMATWGGFDVHTAERRRGWLTLSEPLARDAGSIDVGGLRIGLASPPAPVAIEFEGPSPTTPVMLLARTFGEIRSAAPALLDQLRDPERSPVETVLAALVATGELSPDDPLVTQARLLVEARLAGPGSPLPAGLAEPWASLLGPGGADTAPWAVRTLSGVVPAVNGRPVALEALTSTIAYAELRLVELAPTGPVRSPAPSLLDPLGTASGGHPMPGPEPVDWSASDDRGHHHAGQFIRFGSPGQRAYVLFGPPLHPDATELQIIANGPDGRARITVPLGWEVPL
jgi:hypothetical protein